MEKILVAVDPARVNKEVIDFACFIAKLTRSELTAVFLDNQASAAVPLTKAGMGSRVKELVTEPAGAEKRSRAQLCEDTVDFFEEACLNRGVRASVHIGNGMPVREIIMESRFADLLIVDREMSFGKRTEGSPTTFIKEVLAKSECPVIIAPYTFNGIDEILFVYDGTGSSLFAIKQFAYLFPELSDNRITVAEIKKEKDELPSAEKKLLGSFLQMHYSSIGFRVLQGNSGDELLSYLIDRKNFFVVTGPFSHAGLELLLKTVNLPVFVANQ